MHMNQTTSSLGKAKSNNFGSTQSASICSKSTIQNKKPEQYVKSFQTE